MRINKRILSLLMIVTMFLSSVAVFGQSDFSDIKWVSEPKIVDSEGKRIDVYGTLQIPDEYKGNTKISLEINGLNVNPDKNGSFTKSIFIAPEIEIKVFTGKNEIVELGRTLKYVMDKTNVNEVIRLIDELPNIDELKLDDKDVISVVRMKYDALTPEEKELVTNYLKLEAAVSKLKGIAKLLVEERLEAIPKVINTAGGVNYEEVELALQAVREAIEIAEEVGWTQEEIRAFEQYDKIRGTEVQVMIFRLPRYGEINYVNLEEARPLVIAARGAYDSLTESEKSFVWTTSKLESDEERIIELDFLLELMDTTPENFESLIREYAEGIQLDLTDYDSLKDKTPVNEELAGKEYKAGNGWSGGKYLFRIDFYAAVARQKEKESVDKTALAAAIQEGEDLLDTEGASEAAIEELISALDEAARIYLNENATQAQVDEAVIVLNQAIEKFKESLTPPVDPDLAILEAAKAYLIGKGDDGLVNKSPTQLVAVTIRVPSQYNEAIFRFSEDFEYGEEERNEGEISVRSRDSGTGLPFELSAKRDKTNSYTVRVKLLIIKGEVSDFLTYEIFVPKDGKRADPILGTPGVPAEPVTIRLLQ